MKLTTAYERHRGSQSELTMKYPSDVTDALELKGAIKRQWGSKSATIRVINANADSHLFQLAKTTANTMQM